MSKYRASDNLSQGFPHLTDLLADLRRAAKYGPEVVRSVLAESAEDARLQRRYAAALRAEVSVLVTGADATHLLTDTGIVDEDGLIAGISGRLAARALPPEYDTADLAGALSTLIHPGDTRWLASLTEEAVADWCAAVGFAKDPFPLERLQLASALLLLATRVAGAGVDRHAVEHLPHLDNWSSPFQRLMRATEDFASRMVASDCTPTSKAAVLDAVDACLAQIAEYRAAKMTLGTTLTLSSKALRMEQQLERIRTLVEAFGCRTAAPRTAVAGLAFSLVLATARRYAVLEFARQKLDLIAYLIVGHAAKKGERFATRTPTDLRNVTAASLLGGVLVAAFGLAKLWLPLDSLAPLPTALLAGANYALCFALIYLLGATLATKQPAVTASRLADALAELGSGTRSFARLVRAIWRTQFVSLAGNVAAAAAVSLGIGYVYTSATGAPVIDTEKAQALAASLHPLESNSWLFAAIAGVLLSLAGIIAGFADNAVVFHRLARRIRAGRGLASAIPRRWRDAVARRVDAKLGGVVGSVVLGFMLAAVAPLGDIVGLGIDIRHVAFASSHGAVAVAYGGVAVTQVIIAVAAGVLVIGMVNFLVSFGVTLVIALESRKIAGVDWGAAAGSVARLFVEDPLAFILPRAETDDAPTPTPATTLKSA